MDKKYSNFYVDSNEETQMISADTFEEAEDYIWMPAKAAGRIPAVALLHGGNGLDVAEEQSEQRLNDLGIATFMRAACSTDPCSSSVRATPFSTRTSARRAPQILIGSYDAFSTSTGVCIAGWRKTPMRTSSSVVRRGELCALA